MMKKIITVILAVVMCMGMTGCSLFETFSNDDEDTVTSYRDVNSLKNNKAYIWHNDKESDIQKDLENPADYDVFFQCIKGDINFKGEENDDTYGNNRSIWISSENDKDIPTLSSGDMLIYVSDDSVPDTISFERFADYGYSIGISNLTADEGGHYYFPYEESDEDEYKRLLRLVKKKKEGAVIENMLVALIGIVMMTAFLVIIFGAFSSISNKWQMRQVAREYMLLMETKGYLSDTDKATLLDELKEYGLKDVDLSGTTLSPVGYGDRIYLCIKGTYDENVLAFADGISKVAKREVTVQIKLQTTAKQ